MFKRLVILVLSCSLSVAVLEAGAWAYLRFVLGHHRTYRVDRTLGWSLAPSLSIDYGTHTYTTDTHGLRASAAMRYRSSADAWLRDGRPKLLVIGDSFVEARRVAFERRFDRAMVAADPGVAVLAVGCGGYGTDQALLMAQPWLDHLGPGDAVVLLTCGNDFGDLLRRYHSGRAKPYYDADFRLHRPAIGWYQVARDRLALVAVINRLINSTERRFSPERLAWSFELYTHLLATHLKPLVARGVRVVVAHHTDWRAGFEPDWGLVASLGIGVIALDPHTVGDGPQDASNSNLHDNMHWNAKGHALAGRALAEFMGR